MSFRVHVPGMSYRGSDRRKLEKMRRDHRLCALIREELQRQYDEIRPGEWRAIMAYQVASAIGQDPEDVRLIMSRIQGGSNGVTFHKPVDLSMDPVARTEPTAGSDDTSSSGLALGQRVSHGMFGEGAIVHIAGNRIEVDFEHAGRKRVLESFVSVAMEQPD